MNDPIISPWFIYWITRIDNIKCFLELFPLLFMIVVILVAMLKGFTGEFDDYGEGKENSRKYVKKVLKVGIITIPLAIMLNLFIPNTKVLTAMYGIIGSLENVDSLDGAFYLAVFLGCDGMVGIACHVKSACS